jgi:hypothetical protein
MTREEKLATIAAAHDMFVQLMETTCPRAEIEQYRANVERLTGRPAEPAEGPEDQARLEAVLAAARSQRASR